MANRTYRLTEIVGTSPEGIDDAIRNGVHRAGQTLRHLDWFEVTEVRGLRIAREGFFLIDTRPPQASVVIDGLRRGAAVVPPSGAAPSAGRSRRCGRSAGWTRRGRSRRRRGAAGDVALVAEVALERAERFLDKTQLHIAAPNQLRIVGAQVGA